MTMLDTLSKAFWTRIRAAEDITNLRAQVATDKHMRAFNERLMGVAEESARRGWAAADEARAILKGAEHRARRLDADLLACQGERDAAQDRIAELLGEAQAQGFELQRLKGQGDCLRIDVARLTEAGIGVLVQRDTAREERDALAARVAELHSALRVAQGQRDAANARAGGLMVAEARARLEWQGPVDVMVTMSEPPPLRAHAMSADGTQCIACKVPARCITAPYPCMAAGTSTAPGADPEVPTTQWRQRAEVAEEQASLAEARIADLIREREARDDCHAGPGTMPCGACLTCAVAERNHAREEIARLRSARCRDCLDGAADGSDALCVFCAAAEAAAGKLAALAEYVKLVERERDQARAAVRLATADAGEVWFWQGVGDRPESLSCPVVMSAATLREMLAARRDLATLTAAARDFAACFDWHAGQIYVRKNDEAGAVAALHALLAILPRPGEAPGGLAVEPADTTALRHRAEAAEREVRRMTEWRPVTPDAPYRGRLVVAQMHQGLHQPLIMSRQDDGSWRERGGAGFTYMSHAVSGWLPIPGDVTELSNIQPCPDVAPLGTEREAATFYDALALLSRYLPGAALDLPPSSYDLIAALPGARMEVGRDAAGGEIERATAQVGRLLVQARRKVGTAPGGLDIPPPSEVADPWLRAQKACDAARAAWGGGGEILAECYSALLLMDRGAAHAAYDRAEKQAIAAGLWYGAHQPVAERLTELRLAIQACPVLRKAMPKDTTQRHDAQTRTLLNGFMGAVAGQREPMTALKTRVKDCAPEMCHAATDGDCNWAGCPQNRDGEPKKSGRHCPLDDRCDSELCQRSRREPADANCDQPDGHAASK